MEANSPLDPDPQCGGAAKLFGSIMLNSEALVVRISQDREYCAVGLSSGSIQLHPMPHKAGRLRRIELMADGEKLPCTDVTFVTKHSERKRLIAAYASGFVRLWQYTNSGTGSLSHSWLESEHSLYDTENSEKRFNQIMCLSLSSDNKRFITGGSDTIIRLYEVHSASDGRLLIPNIRTDATHAHNFHTNRVTALSYHPKGGKDPTLSHFFVSASWDGTIQGWDDRASGSLWQYAGTYVAGADGLCLDPTRGLLLAASYRHDKVLAQVWDSSFRKHESQKLTSILSKPLSTISQDSSSPAVQVYVARLTSDGHLIIFGGTNANFLKLMSSSTLRPIATVSSLNCGVYSADSCHDPADRRRLIVSFTNGCRVYHILIDQKQQHSYSDTYQ